MEFHTSDSWKLPFPKCPYNKSLVQWIIRLGLIGLGTYGLIFLNIWLSAIYFLFGIGYTFLIMPFRHCKHCYYNMKRNEIDDSKNTHYLTLMPIEEWKENHLLDHVRCGKKWGAPFLFILWLIPIAGLIISLLASFSILPILTLSGFIALLILMGVHMKIRVCTNCAFEKECHEAF